MGSTDKFKQKLLQLRAELQAVEASGNQAADTVELDQSRVGRLSRMDALQAQAMNIESNRRRTVYLKQIATALKRIEEDEYGWCEECGEAISEQRLEFDPAVSLCIDCANKKESNHQTGHK